MKSMVVPKQVFSHGVTVNRIISPGLLFLMFIFHRKVRGSCLSPLIPAEGLVLDDMLQFNENGQFHLIGRRGRVVKIEEKRISLVEIEQRLLALDGIMDVAAIPLIRNGRQAIGVVVVPNKEARQIWQCSGGKLWSCPGAKHYYHGLNLLQYLVTGALLMKYQ